MKEGRKIGNQGRKLEIKPRREEKKEAKKRRREKVKEENRQGHWNVIKRRENR